MKLTAYAVLALACAPGSWLSAASIAAPMPPVQQAATGQADAPADAAKPAAVVLARGRIKAITRPPKPRSTPYRDAVIAIQLTNVEAPDGKPMEKEILVFLWGMRDNKWTAAANYHVGQAITLSLRPWDDVMDQYGAYHRIELEGEEVFQLEPYWAEPALQKAPAQK